MAKLPECERPDWKMMYQQLQSKVSPKYRQFFVEDVQNDCACEIETYDADVDNGMMYLTAPDKVELNQSNKMPLPMIEDISDESILLLLKRVCEGVSGYTTADVVPYIGLLNSNATTEQKAQVARQVRERLVLVDFVPEDCYFLFPDPEFFGILGMNIRGYGSFGIPNSVSRCQYDS